LIPRREKGNEKKGDVLYRPIASAEPPKKTKKMFIHYDWLRSYVTVVGKEEPQRVEMDEEVVKTLYGLSLDEARKERPRQLIFQNVW